MTKSEPNKNTQGGFVPIRRGIYEHLGDGRMTGREWMVYSVLHLKADHLTGICYKISGPALGYLLRLKPHYINSLLRSLEQKRYIRRLNHRGQVVCYPVVINKFFTSSGILIDAHNTKSLNEIAWYVEQDCTLTVLQRNVKATSNVLQTSCLQEVKNIRIKEVKKKKGQKAPTPELFTPPTVEEVKKYATDIGFSEVDAERFVEWYAADDWRLKDGSPMRSWKRAVVSWKSTERKREKDEQVPIPEPAMPTAEQLKIATEAEKQ